MAAATRSAAVGGSNPSEDGGPMLRLPPGKGNKPVALADITNTGRPNASRSISVAEVLKENAKLVRVLNEKTKIIELARVEMQKLRLTLQASRQQNMQMAQSNSQMLAELNTGKDRLKVLQHELSCTTSLLKVKDSELEQKNKTAKQRRNEANSKEVLKAIPSSVAAVEAHRINGSVATGVEHQLIQSQSAVPSNTICQELPQDATKRRGTNKRKLESNECIKGTDIRQENFKPHLQPIMSLAHEDTSKPQRRRSSRLNQVSCEIPEVSDNTLHEDTVVPSAPSNLSVQEQHGPTTGKDMGKSLQNECNAVMNEVFSSEVEEIEVNEQPQKETNLKEIQEACSRVGVEGRQIDVKTCNTKQNHFAGQSSVPSNTIDPTKPPEDTGIKRSSTKEKLALCETRKVIEDRNSKCDTTTSESLRQENKRKSQRKSVRLNSVSSEGANNTFETLHEDVIAPLASSSSNPSMEQTNHKQSDACAPMRSSEGQVAGRRSLRRAAEKVVSYKEIPLNVKMRRP